MVFLSPVDSLIDQIKSEKTPEKPQKPKPTVEDFAAAIGEPAKSSDLKALLEQWKAFESRAEVPEKLIKRIREAMKG